jgi:hypothetical protein
MIHVDFNDGIAIKGPKPIVQAELITLMKTLFNDASFTEDDVQESIKVAKMSTAELESEIEDMKNKIGKQFADSIVSNIISGLFDEESK